jgi:hypothetical protein
MMPEMTDFEVLKKLLEYRVTLRRRGGNEPDFTHYLLSVDRGDAMKSVQIHKSQWDTPAAAQAMRLLLHTVAVRPPVLRDPRP